MDKKLLIFGIVSIILSFIIHPFFLQFLVLGALLIGFYLANRRSKEMEELKKMINEHNELMKQDIDLLKKDKLY